MEAVIFMGIQGAGKSSFYKERFFLTHLRLSLDLLKTRHREQQFLNTCLQTGQRFVIDNTNATRVERHRYLAAAKAARFGVLGYYFESKVAACLQRNAQRLEAERVPKVAILGTANKFDLPSRIEGFDQLYYVWLEGRRWIVEEWNDEIH